MNPQDSRPETLRSLLDAARSEHTIFQLIAENGGEITPELDEQLKRIELLPAKIDGYKNFFDMCEIRMQMLDMQADRLVKLKKGIAVLEARVKKYMELAMRERGLQEIKGEWHRFKFVKCAKRTVIDDEKKIPAKYLVTEVLQKVDKVELKKDLEAGVAIDGAHLEGGETLKDYANTDR